MHRVESSPSFLLVIVDIGQRTVPSRSMQLSITPLETDAITFSESVSG